MTAASARNSLDSQLRGRFIARLDTRIRALDESERRIRTDGLSPEVAATVLEHAHALAGSGGSFGFHDISHAGRALEDHIDAGPSDPAATALKIHNLLALLRNAYESAPEPEEAVAAAPAVRDTPRPRVLIVEDDETTAELLAALVTGYAEVLTAADATTARLLIDHLKPALVLLDNHVGAPNAGVDLLETLQATPGLRDIPVIMITASDQPADVMRALVAGAADYIPKPFNPDEVGDKIRGRLQRLATRILVADDDDTVREMLVHKLQGAGCSVTSVSDGNDAWEALSKETFSLALLDRMMPGFDGVTLLRMMKARAEATPEMPEVPVIFLTARRYGADVVEGLNTGAVDYITKPFNADEVLARVLRILKSEDRAEGGA